MGMGGSAGRTTDQKGTLAAPQVKAPSGAPVMPGMAAGQQSAPAQAPGAMPGASVHPSRPMKAKSEVAGPVAQRAVPVEAVQQVVFVLRVLDPEQIAAEKSVRAKSDQAKAAVMDAARVAPVEAKPSEPAKPAASASPAKQ